MDFFAELLVGRIPCYDLDEDGNLDFADLDAILSKSMAYEGANIFENSWRRRTLTSCPYVANIFIEQLLIGGIFRQI